MKNLILLLFAVFAAYSEGTDSIKTYKSNEVVVSASRTEILIKNSPSFLNVINSDEIERINGEKLADKIISAPGIVFKDYGYGGLKTISMRGMGAEHTLILFDGEKINSDQNGMCDLNNVLIDEVEKIEIIRGGSSAYYGANAVGGVINIIPKTNFDRFGFKAGYSIGSNQYRKLNLGTTGTVIGISYSVSFLKEQADNDYKYRFDDGGSIFEGNRKNASYNINQFSANFNSGLSDYSSVNLFTKYFYSNRDIPNIITVNISKANQVDEDFLSILKYNYNIGKFNLSLSPSFRYSSYDYTDPNLSDGTNFLHGSSKIYRYGINTTANTILSENISSLAGIEYYSTDGECVNYSNKKNRTQFGSFLSAEIVLFQGDLLPVLIYPAIRYDYFSDFGSQISPKIGANINLFNSEFFIKTGYSDNFRAPTFNDLYWNPGGNPDLKPEHSQSFDAGLSYYNNELFNLTADINYFYIYTKNRIVWLPEGGAIWKPKNIKDVQSKGMESNIELAFFEKALNLNANYSYTEAINSTAGDVNEGKLIPFIPKHNFRTGLSVNYWKIGFGFQFRFVSSRYSEESNERLSKLDYYHLADAFIQYKTKITGLETSLKFETNNVYNSEYVVMPYYPTPLRDYKFSIIINYYKLLGD